MHPERREQLNIDGLRRGLSQAFDVSAPQVMRVRMQVAATEVLADLAAQGLIVGTADRVIARPSATIYCPLLQPRSPMARGVWRDWVRGSLVGTTRGRDWYPPGSWVTAPRGPGDSVRRT